MAKLKASNNNGMYTRDDYQALRNARTALNDLISVLDKAKACGVNCSMYTQMRDDIDGQLAKIEQHFMSEHRSASGV